MGQFIFFCSTWAPLRKPLWSPNFFKRLFENTAKMVFKLHISFIKHYNVIIYLLLLELILDWVLFSSGQLLALCFSKMQRSFSCLGNSGLSELIFKGCWVPAGCRPVLLTCRSSALLEAGWHHLLDSDHNVVYLGLNTEFTKKKKAPPEKSIVWSTISAV